MKNIVFKLTGFLFLMFLAVSVMAQEPDAGSSSTCSPQQLEELKSLALRSFSLVDRNNLPLLIHCLAPSLKTLNEEAQVRAPLLSAYDRLIGSPCPDAATLRLKRGCAFFLSKCGEKEKARRLYIESYRDSKNIDLKSEFEPLGDVIFSLTRLGFFDDALRLAEEVPDRCKRQHIRMGVLAVQQEVTCKSPANRAIFPALAQEIQTFSGTNAERIQLLSLIQSRYHQAMLKLYGKSSSKMYRESPWPDFARIAENLLSSRRFCLALLYPSSDSLSILSLAQKAAFSNKIPLDLRKRFFEILFKRALRIEDFNQQASTLYELYTDRELISETSEWNDAIRRIFRHSDQLTSFGNFVVLPGFPTTLLGENRLQEAISLVTDIPDLEQRNRVFLQLARDSASVQRPATWSILFNEAEKTGLVTSEDRLCQILSRIDSEVLSESATAGQVDTLMTEAMEEWKRYLAQKNILSFPRLFESYAATLIQRKRAGFLLSMASAVSDKSLRGCALGLTALEFHKQHIPMPPEIRSGFDDCGRIYFK